MEAVATKSGGFGGGVEWAGSRSGQIDQCVGELGGARPTIGCQDGSSTYTCRCMVGDRRGGS